MRARYYDTDSGRFTRRDSYEGSLEVPLTLNKYIYTHSDPVNGIDPLGLANFEMGKAVEALLRVDFKLQNYEERDFDIQIAAKDPRANTIWKRRGISYKSIPFHLVSNQERRGRPDLIDYENKQLYEIKTEKDFSKGEKEVNQYLTTMNKVDASWNPGSVYIPPPILPVPGFGTVFVRGPRKGVITYREAEFNRQVEVETLLKLLTIIIIDYISLKSVTKSLAI